MLINSKEIINIINKKREEIYKCVSDLNTNCVVTLFGEDNSRLIAGVKGIGNSEYGDIVYWDEELTEEGFQYLTIENINRWLSADRAMVQASGKGTFHLSL